MNRAFEETLRVQASGAMRRLVAFIAFAIPLGFSQLAVGQLFQRVVDIPARPSVTQRFGYLTPANPKAAVILFAGGDGSLQIAPDGGFTQKRDNFLVRTRQQFVEKELSVAVIDAPSDRQTPPFLDGFRQRPEHVADIKGVIAWLKQQGQVPVWLVGTSMGTLSAAFIATQLGVSEGGPDGLVLTSTVLVRPRVSPGIRPVPGMPLDKLAIPVLVVHHEQDGCGVCEYQHIPRLMGKINAVSKKELLTFKGGYSRGDPCGGLAYHGFNGIEKDVVEKIAAWIQSH